MFKKRLPILLIAIGIIAAICAVVIVSCSISPSDSDEGSTTDTSLSTAEGTVTEGSHLAQSEDSESIYVTENPPETEATSPSTEGTPTEKPTEPEAETEPAPAPSLDFLSNGNGTCTLIGIGTVEESYISIPSRSPDGDVVISVAAEAFCGNSRIKAIEIPSTVMSIGDKAFSSCASLLYITVDKNNTMFTDLSGVLYTKDLSTLLCYPSGSGVSSVNISSLVKTISPMAFHGCNNLKTVVYDGSAESWSKIIMGELNYGLYSASVIFNEES